jgi:hypothetical protein
LLSVGFRQLGLTLSPAHSERMWQTSDRHGGNLHGSQTMKLTFKNAFTGLLLVFSFAGPVVAGPLDDGDAAYGKGDYATALRLWRPLAEQGNAPAQSNLGVMYLDGKGVPRNYAEAAKWFRLAADQGRAKAQNNLGAMYLDGKACRRTTPKR